MSVTEKLKSLPTKPGVYLFKDKQKKVLYVGKAKNLRNRIRSYFQKSRSPDPRLQIMIDKINDLEYIITDSEIEALILEANLIKENKPRYNVNLKDDKSFPYIRITAEDFPQVFSTRTMIRDGSSYFGPYTNVRDMRNALNTLKRIFSIRSCQYDLNPMVIEKKKVSLCLDYYIHKCKGPCQQLQDKDDYNLMIGHVREFLRGKTSGLRVQLEQEMQIRSEEQKYEEAARIRDKIGILEKYRNSQKIVLPDQEDRDVFAMAVEEDDACAVIFKIREGKVINRVHFYLSTVRHQTPAEILEYFINQYYSRSDEIPRELFLTEEISQGPLIEEWLSTRVDHKVSIVVPKIGEKKKLMTLCEKNAAYLLEELKLQKMKSKDYIPHSLRSLQRDLRLNVIPRRIECFDISNIQGSDPVASMVCFINGRPKKSEYRKFSIKSKSTPDDFAMMKEVINRRYSRLLREKKELPQLIVVDGGKGQLSSALSVLESLALTAQPVIGLAKRLEEIFFPGIPDAQILPRTSSSLRLLQQIRDEAHRFAITFHRQKRTKRTLRSDLDNIPGIGPQRRNLLLSRFGSIKKLKNLTPDDLIKKGKMPVHLAHKIYDHFHPDQGKQEQT
jgi:excinuclease ABC subunit C